MSPIPLASKTRLRRGLWSAKLRAASFGPMCHRYIVIASGRNSYFLVFGIIQTAKGFRLGVILATTGLFVAEGD